MTAPRRGARVSVKGRLAIASAFAAVMVAGLALSYWASGRPSAASECATRCSTSGKVGAMVYSGPDTPKSAYKAAHRECTRM
jgi:hypothetical protein